MIKQIKYNEIPFLKNEECKSLGIIFSDKYQYLAYFISGNIVGVVGYKVFKDSAYLGCAYVCPNHRFKGIYKSLNIERFNNLKVKTITANCTENSLYFHLKNGAKIIKQYKNKITKITYEKNI